MEKSLQEKLELLTQYFIKKGSAAIAFSGGVDSTFLLKVAHDALGDRAVAVTVISSFIPESERQEAVSFCSDSGIPQKLLDVDILGAQGVASNPKDRCYICKKHIFTLIKEYSREQGLAAVCEGSNLDDLGDYRPGLKAISELEICSPLRECGFTKAEIREASRALGLDTWKKPSFACLASRFVYGQQITEQKLRMVEQAEIFLKGLGFVQYRVRIHDLLARIEVPLQDMDRLYSYKNEIYQKLKALGFEYIAMDLGGFKSGSMNVGV